MKSRIRLLALPLVLLSLESCRKAEKPPEIPLAEAPAAEPAAAVPPPAPAEAPAEPAPQAAVALTLEQRAAKLGFAKYLPQDTEAFIAFHNGHKAATAIENSKAWALLQEGMNFGGPAFEMDEMEFDPEMEDGFAIPEEDEQEIDGANLGADDEPQDPEVEITEVDLAELGLDGDMGMDEEFGEPLGANALLGTEFGVALGKGSGKQLANLTSGLSRVNYLQTRAMARALVAVAKSGDPEMFAEIMFEHSMNQWTEFMNDPDSGVGLIEKLEVPALYLSFKVDAENREVAAQQISSTVDFLANFDEMVETVEFESAGSRFVGYRLIGANVAATMEESRDEEAFELDEEVVDRLIATIKTKDLVMASGIVGDYVVMFVGPSVEACALVSDVNTSLVNSDTLKYADALLNSELAFISHGEADVLKGLIDANHGVAEMAEAIREGLSGEDGLDNSRDLESMLQIVAEREMALRKMVSVETFGMVGVYDQGLRIETFGGVDDGAADWEATSKLSALGDSEDVVVFASMSSNAAYDAAARAYLEALVETGYAMAMKFTEFEVEGEEMEKAREMLGLFDEKFRPELAAIWRTLNSGFADSLGNDMALVVDLNGSMPAFKGVPQAVVDTARFARVSMIAPVNDRAALSVSWEPVNASATNLMAAISNVLDDDIPMPKPMRSVEDNYTSWFFSLPFTDEDFIPCVTVGDDWFVASSSRLQSMELITKANAVSAEEERKGNWFRLNFAALQKFGDETLKIVEEHAAAIFGEDSAALAEFEENKGSIKKVISVLEDLDSLTAHSRREDGVLRTTIHFKTR